MKKAMTNKQGKLLFSLYKLKFWEPASAPPPSLQEASALIDASMAWVTEYREGSHNVDLLATIRGMIRQWFPDWDGQPDPNFFRCYSKRKKSSTSNRSRWTREANRDSSPQEELPLPTDAENSSSDAPTDANGNPHPEQEQPMPERAPMPEPEPAPEGLNLIEQVMRLIDAGQRNFYLYGPAGTGKTTQCQMIAEELGIPCTILSCSAGTSPAEITGFKYPEPRPSAISAAIGQPGIIVFDELTMLDPAVAAVANALLANDTITTSTGTVKRHRKCTIIATANTIGDGATRQYIGNNQLDAATLDRFVGGYFEVQYSAAYERANTDPEVRQYVELLRQVIEQHGLERIASTRAIQAGERWKRAGMDWRKAITAQWTPEEIALIPQEQKAGRAAA